MRYYHVSISESHDWNAATLTHDDGKMAWVRSKDDGVEKF
jgi:hypothetical protein